MTTRPPLRERAQRHAGRENDSAIVLQHPRDRKRPKNDANAFQQSVNTMTLDHDPHLTPSTLDVTLGDLTPDPRNARKHTPRNVGMIVDALQEVGVGRSIVIDENNVVLAGNATIEAAAEAGLQRVRVVETDGNTLIAVRRRGLTDAQKTRLALYDNRAAELAGGWDVDVLKSLAPSVSLDGLWSSVELERLTLKDIEVENLAIPERHDVLVTCHTDAQQRDLLERLHTEGYECRALIS